MASAPSGALLDAIKLDDLNMLLYLLKRTPTSLQDAAPSSTQKLLEIPGSALHWACYVGNPSVVATLLEHGAHPYTLESDGKYPLHWAAYEGHYDVVVLLLHAEHTKDDAKTGLRPSMAQDKLGMSPRQLALIRGHDAVAALLPEVRRSKVPNEASGNVRDTQTPKLEPYGVDHATNKNNNNNRHSEVLPPFPFNDPFFAYVLSASKGPYASAEHDPITPITPSGAQQAEKSFHSAALVPATDAPDGKMEDRSSAKQTHPTTRLRPRERPCTIHDEDILSGYPVTIEDQVMDDEADLSEYFGSSGAKIKVRKSSVLEKSLGQWIDDSTCFESFNHRVATEPEANSSAWPSRWKSNAQLRSSGSLGSPFTTLGSEEMRSRYRLLHPLSFRQPRMMDAEYESSSRARGTTTPSRFRVISWNRSEKESMCHLEQQHAFHNPRPWSPPSDPPGKPWYKLISPY